MLNTVASFLNKNVLSGFSEWKVCRSGDVRWSMYFLQYGPNEILHDDPREIVKGQKLAGQESYGHRTYAG